MKLLALIRTFFAWTVFIWCFIDFLLEAYFVYQCSQNKTVGEVTLINVCFLIIYGFLALGAWVYLLYSNLDYSLDKLLEK